MKFAPQLFGKQPDSLADALDSFVERALTAASWLEHDKEADVFDALCGAMNPRSRLQPASRMAFFADLRALASNIGVSSEDVIEAIIDVFEERTGVPMWRRRVIQQRQSENR